MRYSLLVLPILALSACATPRESCISTAQNQIRTLQGKIQTAEGNIDRGFAIFRSTDTREIEATCTNRLPDGTLETYECNRTETFTTSDPVAIDVAEERVKLAGLQRRLGPLQDATDTAIQQCIAIHPE